MVDGNGTHWEGSQSVTEYYVYHIRVDYRKSCSGLVVQGSWK